MALKSVASVQSTASKLIFTSTNGINGAPESLLIQNNDASIIVYIGGEDVTASNGMPIAASASISIDLISGERVYAIGASGTPELRLLNNRE